MSKPLEVTAASHPALHYAFRYCGALSGASYPCPSNVVWLVYFSSPAYLAALEAALAPVVARGRLGFGLWFHASGRGWRSRRSNVLPGARGALRRLSNAVDTFDGLGCHGPVEGAHYLYLYP